MTIYVVAEFPRFLFKFKVVNRIFSAEELSEISIYPTYCALSGEKKYLSYDFAKDITAFIYNIFFNPYENIKLIINKRNHFEVNKKHYTSEEIIDFLNNEYHSHPLLLDTNYKNTSLPLIGFPIFNKDEHLFKELSLSEVAIIDDFHHSFDINFHISKLNEDAKFHLLGMSFWTTLSIVGIIWLCTRNEQHANLNVNEVQVFMDSYFENIVGVNLNFF